MPSTPSVHTLRKKNAVYQGNVNKRGHVKPTLKEEPKLRLPVPTWVLAILAFALFGGGKIKI
ncbi:hypothetical protein BJ944DRAFT_267641 [Cunninghamella echinulata]|nr:hypothetical protein BJ944DRAFT_267641 [Cunninghamella echinulata]